MSRRTRVIDTVDRHNRAISRAIIELSDAYETFLKNAASSGAPPTQASPEVFAAHRRYRRTVANARAAVRRIKKGTPNRATALKALGELDAGLKNIEEGLAATNLRLASDAAKKGNRRIRAYRGSFRTLQRTRRGR